MMRFYHHTCNCNSIHCAHKVSNVSQLHSVTEYVDSF
jgi:hypothetical protein